MKHFITLTPEQFVELDSPMLADDKTTFSKGDELVIEVEGTRDQSVVTISSINREKVHKGYCYLGLTGIDDLRTTL